MLSQHLCRLGIRALVNLVFASTFLHICICLCICLCICRCICLCICMPGIVMVWRCSHLDSVGSILSTRTKSALAAPLYSSGQGPGVLPLPSPQRESPVERGEMRPDMCGWHPRGLPYTTQCVHLCSRLSSLESI